MDHAFLEQLLERFRSEAPLEREGAKMVLHHIYSSFVAMRQEIRRCLSGMFREISESSRWCNGLLEVLQIFSTFTVFRFVRAFGQIWSAVFAQVSPELTR